MLVDAIGDAGYPAGRDGIAIALDPAASEFHREGAYQIAGDELTSDQLIDWYAEIVDRFPIWSIEDGRAEDHWDGRQAMTRAAVLWLFIRVTFLSGGRPGRVDFHPDRHLCDEAPLERDDQVVRRRHPFVDQRGG